jgi:hypothetical protein
MLEIKIVMHVKYMFSGFNEKLNVLNSTRSPEYKILLQFFLISSQVVA